MNVTSNLLICGMLVGAFALLASGCRSSSMPPPRTENAADMRTGATGDCLPVDMILSNGDTATICSLNFEIHDDANGHITIVLHDGWAIVTGCNTTVETPSTVAGDSDKSKRSLPGLARVFVGITDTNKNDVVTFDQLLSGDASALKVKRKTWTPPPPSPSPEEKDPKPIEVAVVTSKPPINVYSSPLPPPYKRPNLRKHDRQEIVKFLSDFDVAP